eukprot:scaffold102541_cov105-Phaeocystis_antarctica.AAC.1
MSNGCTSGWLSIAAFLRVAGLRPFAGPAARVSATCSIETSAASRALGAPAAACGAKACAVVR